MHMKLIETKVRWYGTEFGYTKPVRVWKLLGVVVWRRNERRATC
jgi:hypothetical protein